MKVIFLQHIFKNIYLTLEHIEYIIIEKLEHLQSNFIKEVNYEKT